MNPEIDAYLVSGCGRCKLYDTPACKVHRWPNELRRLRALVLSCGLVEERKWSMPCYTYKGKNVIMVSAFKDYAALSFFKGSLLKDEAGLLKQHGENSQAVRLFRFTSEQQIEELEPLLRAYIFEAIELEKSGAKISFTQKDELEYPEELLARMDEDPDLQAAFEALTPGRKRGYVLHFSQAKQSATRLARIDKCRPKILDGKGWNDR